MSYILEALKKAERERGMSRLPTLTTVHDYRSSRWSRSVLVAGGLVACAAVLLWLFRPADRTIMLQPDPSLARGEQKHPMPPRNEVTSEIQEPAAAVPSAEPETIEKTQRLPDTAATAASLPASALLPPAGLESRPYAAPQAIPATRRRAVLQSSATDIAMPSEQGETTTPAPTKPATPAVPAQPATLREAISKMTLSLLVYADAEPERKVYINGKKYVKGDLVEGRYRLENITQEGAVLSYEGERALLRP